jgi:hypothetical protein
MPANSKTPLIDKGLYAKFVKFAKKNIYIYTGIFTQTPPLSLLKFFIQQTWQTSKQLAFFSSLYQYLKSFLLTQK